MKIHVGDELEPDKPSKTEVLFVTRPSKMYQNPSTYDATDLSNINIGDHCHFPIVDKFCYLGSIISRDCKDTLDLIHRIRKAENAFGALKRSIFSSRRISDSAKSSAYQSLILPILLYGAESWCLTESFLRQLRNFHHSCLRAMCEINRTYSSTISAPSNSLPDCL